jgi:hypothetical protein
MRGRRLAGAFALGILFALWPAWAEAQGGGRPIPGVWRIGGDARVTVFAEQTSVGPGQGGAVRMPSIWVLRRAEQTPLGGSMKYFVAAYEYDCAASRFRLAQIATYSADGDVIEPDLGGTGFQEAEPGSLNETLLRAACAPFASWMQLGARRISAESRSPVELAAYADFEFQSGS